jgi:hypothetical protein
MNRKIPNNAGDILLVEKMRNMRHINDISNRCTDGNISIFV